jgi:serine/threonine protein phosphatase 1
MTKKLNTWAVGDIHGELPHLLKMVKLIEDIEDGNDYILQPLGDYVDRGPNSKGVIDFFMHRQAQKGKELVRPVLGNHEVMAFESHHDNGYLRQAWVESGGHSTLSSYPGYRISNIHLDWIESLPFYQEDDKRFYVHAGVYPGIELASQNRNHLIWIREQFLNSRYDWGKLIVHGHTTTYTDQPDIFKNRVNLDTGCCFGYKLSAARFEEDITHPTKILQV